MTEARPLDRVLTDWLHEDAPPRARAELLDRTLERVAAVAQDRVLVVGIPALRQRHEGDRVSARVSLALSAAAMLIVAILVVGLIRSNDSVGPVPSPSATASASAEIAMPAAPGPLSAGRYRIAPSFDVPLALHVVLPTGWAQAGWALQKADAESFISFWTVENTYLDPCHWATSSVNPGVGPFGNFLGGLQAELGAGVSSATPVTVGGFDGQRVTITAPNDIGREPCDGDEYRYWVSPGAGDGSRFVPVDARYAGYTDTVWILDVDGIRVVIDLTEAPGVGADDRAEARDIVEAVEIEAQQSLRFGACDLSLTAGGDNTPLGEPYAVSMAPRSGQMPAASVLIGSRGWKFDAPPQSRIWLRRPSGQPRLSTLVLSDAGGAELLLDAAGTWRLNAVSPAAGCIADVPIEVLPADTG